MDALVERAGESFCEAGEGVAVETEDYGGGGGGGGGEGVVLC